MAVKFITKVLHTTEDDLPEWAFLAKNLEGEPALVESVVGLYNKGFQLYDNAQEAIQLAKDCGFVSIKLVTFEAQADGKPYLEVEIA